LCRFDDSDRPGGDRLAALSWLTAAAIELPSSDGTVSSGSKE